MVDELLHQKNGYDINNIQNSHTSDLQIDYIRRDDGSVSGRMSDSASDGSINSLVNHLYLISIRLVLLTSILIPERNEANDKKQ